MSEVCSENEISQAQYYQWRDRFLSKAHKAFEPERADWRLTKLERENAKLKGLVGELTLELKKATRSYEAGPLRQGGRAQAWIFGPYS